MTFALLARRTTLLATRRATASSTSAMTKRRMGGSAAPAPEWEGIDKVVRGYFPQDDQRELNYINIVHYMMYEKTMYYSSLLFQ